MSTHEIHIEQLEIFARVGVTENERAQPQRLTVTITAWPRVALEELRDDIAQAVNYSTVCAASRDFMRERSYKLIETFATELASHLLKTFPIEQIRIELRKFVVPDTQHVSVTVTRSASG